MTDDECDGERFEFAFVPEHLRHHFRVDVFGGDAQKQRDVRDARRARSAHLVSTALSADARKAAAPVPGTRLYSVAAEHAVTSRMTFDRTRRRLCDYFEDASARLKVLDEAEPAAAVPAWLYDERVRLPTLLQVQRHVVQAVESCVSDSDVYLAMFEPLPSPPASSPTPRLRFAACSSKSAMAHQTIVRAGVAPREPRSNQRESDSISFEAMESRREVAVGDIDGCAQLQRFTPETVTGPFACFPLLNARASSAIGVLSLDGCRKARRLRPEAMTVVEVSEFLARKNLKDAARELRRHKVDGRQLLAVTERELSHKPAFSGLLVATRKRLLELIHALRRGAAVHLARPARYFLDDPDAMEFLRGVSRASGAFIDGYRGVHWHRTMASATRDVACTVSDVFDVLLRSIAQSLDQVARVVVWRVERQQARVAIDILASTHVQEDRLLPFAQWNERLMKRVVLYRANADASAGRLVQGAITRLILPNQDQTSAGVVGGDGDEPALCELAQYQVSWADRSVERYSWAQLRQLLPVREVNAKHHQFAHLLEQLEGLGSLAANGSTAVVRLQNPNGLALVVADAHYSRASQCVLEVDFSSADEAPPSAVAFLRRAVGITEKSVACVRGRESRRLNRQLSSVRVSREFHAMGLTPSADALRALSEVAARVFAEVVANLPGVEVQVAELQPDGAQLRYTFAANGSSLLGQTLHRGQGVSFRCLDTKTPLVVSSGSELSDRLRRLGRPAEASDADEFPYVFLPLVHEDCVVGVFSVNRFADVSKGRKDEVHPEAGVLQYLESVVQPLGAAVFLKRRAYALYELQQLAREPLRSPHQLLFSACRALKDVLVGAWKVRVVEVDALRGKTSAIYELSESERALASSSSDFRFAAPVRLRSRELQRSTVCQHFALDAGAVAELYATIERREADDEADATKLAQLDADSGRGAASSAVPESERRRLQTKRIAAKYFELTLSESGEADAAALQPLGRIADEKHARHALAAFLGSKTSHFAGVPTLALARSSIFLTVSSLPQFYAACDRHYVARVAETASTLLDDLRQRVERSRRRVAALDVFRAACGRELSEIRAQLGAAVALSPDEERAIEGAARLQQHLVALIEGVFGKTNAYVGLLEPSLQRIRFTCASSGSAMSGKHLKHGDGVGFHVLGSGAPFVVTQRDIDDGKEDAAGVKLERRLRSFAKDAKQHKWPFVSVPVGALGVLSVDDLERYERLACAPQPEIGVVDFLAQLGAELHAVVHGARRASRDARQALRAQALTRILRACDDLRPHAPTYVQTVALQEVEGALAGVDAYIGMVAPLCERVRFTSASSRSAMAGESVDCATSASFRVFASQRPLVLPQLRAYCEHQTDAAVARVGRLRSFGSRAPSGPFVCVPIPFVGVLSVDTFPGAAGGAYMAHVPESGVVAFLSRVANVLGENIRTHNARAAAKRVPELFQGNRSALPLVFQEVLQLVAANVVAAHELLVVRVDRRTRREKLPPVASLARPGAKTRGGGDALAGIMAQARELVLTDASGAVVALPSAPEVLVAVLEPTRDVEDDDAALLPTALVVRRVAGATWTYDAEFLRSLLPHVNDVLRQVNVRVEGLVARRRALGEIERLGRHLDTLPAREAALALPGALRDALDCVADGLGRDRCCDVYVGEREAGGERLTFTSASRASLMENVSLALGDDANRSLVTVQSLEQQQPSVVHLLEDTRDARLLRPLTTKKCARAHVVVPMGDDRVLCADSFGPEAFHPATRRLEADVVQFLATCAQRLLHTLLAVRLRRSCDELAALKAARHANFRRFFATLLQLVRRDLVVLHSQQVLTLAGDFAGAFFTETWHAAATRRPVAGSEPHLCYQSRCEPRLVALGIHHEVAVQLPMTNLPRTLDRSRSSLEPAEGLEKRGVFACACLTAMLDAQFAAPRVALCVYTHDATSRARAPAAFTPTQRRHFFALAAAAEDVFAHVYRSCALFSFAHELFFALRERLGAKEGCVARVQDDAAAEVGGSARVVVVYSSQETKHPTASALREPAASKVVQFFRSGAEVAIFARKRAAPAASPAAAAGARVAASPSARGAAPTSAEQASSSSFFRRPGNLFRKAKAAPEQQAPAASPHQTPHAGGSELQLQQSAPLVKFHVLVRGVAVGGEVEVFSFDIESAAADCAVLLEAAAKRVRADAQRLVHAFLETPPRGDEETLSAVLGREAATSAYGVSSGGGFYLLASLAEARRAFQHESLHLETDIRGHLTGVQPTARDALTTGRSSGALAAHLPPATPSPPSVFADEASPLAQAALVLLRAAMLLVGVRKDALAAMGTRALLAEFLRASVAKKLGEANPRDRKQWGVVLRAKALLQQSSPDNVTPVWAAEASGAVPALQAMWSYVATLVAVVRLLKQRESDAAHEQQRVDRRATAIQCFYRAAQARAKLRTLRTEFGAARTIQCAFRQHLARRRALFLRWTRAATTVQRAYRLKLLRRKGTRPKRLSDELLAISKQFGGLSTPAAASASARREEVADGGEWRAAMDAFDSFGAFVASRAGKEQLRREESVMTRRVHELAKQREKLPPEERVAEDAKDLFELLDTDGGGELSREAMRELLARLRVPLAKDEVEDVVAMMDSDGSGALSLAEFLGWFLHEYPVLRKRSKDCGMVSRKDWRWVVQNSARAALRKRFRALRVGRSVAPEAAAAAVVDATDANEHDELKAVDAAEAAIDR